MLHHPEVQKKVQAEIDEVVGQNRKVTLDDKVLKPPILSPIHLLH